MDFKRFETKVKVIDEYLEEIIEVKDVLKVLFVSNGYSLLSAVELRENCSDCL